MKPLVLLLAFLSIACMPTRRANGQHFATTASYHFGSGTDYLGVSLASNIITWNYRKVMFRGVLSYLEGSRNNTAGQVQTSNRIEMGLENRNGMITGTWLFNVIGASYVLTNRSLYDQTSVVKTRDNSWMFTFGLGTKISDELAIMAKYITGKDNGIRLAMEVRF